MYSTIYSNMYSSIYSNMYSTIYYSNSCLKRSYILQSTQSPTYYLQPIALNLKRDNYHGANIAYPSVCEETGSKLRVLFIYLFILFIYLFII